MSTPKAVASCTDTYSESILLPHGVTRRMMVTTCAAFGLIGSSDVALAQSASPERMQRPKPGDKLVFAVGQDAGQEIAPGALSEGGPQALAWAVDPNTGVVRDGSRLNQVLVVRLAESSLSELTRKRSAGSVVAYSAICPHALCPVTEWRRDLEILHCPCHNSEYDPRQAAMVVNGPALRALASLPLSLEKGVLVVAEPFIGKVGAQQA